jgi:hypothetical protein
MKSARTNGKRTKGETTKSKVSKGQATDRRKKRPRAEPTANELMLEAWKKLYETRRERLL